MNSKVVEIDGDGLYFETEEEVSKPTPTLQKRSPNPTIVRENGNVLLNFKGHGVNLFQHLPENVPEVDIIYEEDLEESPERARAALIEKNMTNKGSSFTGIGTGLVK